MGRDLIHGLVDLVGAVTLLLHHGMVLGGLTGVLWLLVPGAATASRTGSVGAWVARHPRLAVRIGASPSPCSRADVDARTLIPVIATSSVAASGVHLAVAPLHAADGALVVGFFVSVGLLQMAWAAAILLRPTAILVGLGLTLQIAVLGVWLTSRTVGVAGLPVEPVGAWDLAASLWQVIAVAGAAYVLRTGEGLPTATATARVPGRRPARSTAYRWSTPAQLWASASLTVLVTLALEAT